MSVREPSKPASLLAFLGLSVAAGLLVAAAVTPAVAVTSGAANQSITIFDQLPEDLDVGRQVQQNEIYAKRGKKNELIAVVYSQNRRELKWKEVPAVIKNAALAAEDKRFYDHGGIDPQGIVRALGKNLGGSGTQQGGSTLTQQLVKNICVSDAVKKYSSAKQYKKMVKAAELCREGSLTRKLKEMKYAIGLEKKYTKDEILLAYLNIASFGGNTYGIQSAAQRYFGKDAKELSPAQAASILAIVQSPSQRSLDNPDNYEANKIRRDHILSEMLGEKTLSQKQYDKAVATPVSKKTVHLTAPKNGCIAANVYAKQFCDYVVHSVKDLRSLGKDAKASEKAWTIGGYKLYTSLDLSLQKVAQDSIRKYVPNGETRLKLGGAAISVEVGTGRILTMAQNKRFDDTRKGSGRKATAINFNTDYNYGGSSGFQVGSTYKTFTLLNWLDSGHGLSEVVSGNARTLAQSDFTDTCGGPWVGPWNLKNDHPQNGSWTVRNATAQSVNGAFASMAMQLDLCKTKKLAEALGVHTALPFDLKRTKNFDESKLQTNPSSILGTNDISPLTVAAAYAGIANHGVYCTPIAVIAIKDVSGKNLGGQKSKCSRAITKDVAAGAVSALQTAMAGYVANPNDGTPHMGKTGTTSLSKQTWITSSSPKVTTTVWVGNISGNFPMDNLPNGRNLRHLVSKEIMTAVDARYPGGTFDPLTGTPLTGQGVAVGDYAGTTPEAAQSAIQSLGLDYSKQGQVDSSRPAGQVAKQEPAAGTFVSRGTVVKVWLSNGAASKVPNVVGQALSAAQATLAGVGFTTVTQSCAVIAKGSTVVPGTVVSTNPHSGKIVVRTSPVELAIAQKKC